VILEGIEQILKTYKENGICIEQNKMKIIIEGTDQDSPGITRLEELQTHSDTSIYNIVVRILSEYFTVDIVP